MASDIMSTSAMETTQSLGSMATLNTTSASSVGDTAEPPAICGLYDFLMEAVCMCLLCLFGFCGNTLSMVCLSKDKSKTATPFLLVSLEVADTLFLITVLILRVLPTIHTFTGSLPALNNILPYMGKFVFPCALIATTGTIYLTLLVTVNRYVSVCRPYEASNLCSVQHARKHVVLVSVFSVLYNTPRFFEYHVREIVDPRRNMTVLVLRPTDVAENMIYQIVYGNVLYFLVMFLIPLVTLIFLNVKLIKALRRTKRKRAQLLHSTDNSSRSEDDITLVLIVVVLVFVVCQMPALITQILLTLFTRETRSCPHPIFFYERISDLMVVANSSLNFLIYCFCSTKFRQILVQLVCGQEQSDTAEARSTVAGRTGYKAMCSQLDKATATTTFINPEHTPVINGKNQFAQTAC